MKKAELAESDHCPTALGFQYSAGSKVRFMKEVALSFLTTAANCGFQPLELPVAYEPDTFIGPPPRPIRAKDAARVLTAVTPEGSALAVRYEGTAPSARWVAARTNHPDFRGARVAYAEQMVRLEMPEDLDHRHLRAFMQTGVESFQRTEAEHRAALADVLRVNQDWVGTMGGRIVFRVSHVKILARTFAVEGVGADHAQRAVRDVLENGAMGEIEHTLDRIGATQSLRARVMELAELRNAPLDEAVRFEAAHPELGLDGAFSELHDTIDAAQLHAEVQFDPGILRSLAFYGGFTFQGDVGDVREVLGGGEYAGLAEAFGARMPLFAVGTAVGVERIVHALGVRP